MKERLFQIAIEDIRFTNKQQWYVIYLVLLAVAAIITFVFKAPPTVLDASFNISFRIFLSVAAGVVALTGIVLCGSMPATLGRTEKGRTTY